MDEVRALVTVWIADGELELLPVEYEPTREDREHPRYCMSHRHTKHLTSDCWSLKRLFKRKQNANELRIGRLDIRVDPYPAHSHNNEEVNMAECYPFMYEDESDVDNRYYLEDDTEDGWAYMVSWHEIIEEFGEGLTPKVAPDPNSLVKMLQNSVKFRAFFDGFGFTPAARLEITKAIVSIAKVHQESCMSAEGSVPQTIRDESNSVTFSDADRKVPYPHNRPLYITSRINGMELKRTFLDGGASINIMPLSTFKRLGIQDNRIVESPITITGFRGDCKRS
ncbi:hypothetical protein RHMOL_Rhmol05G0180800 [Rhododendron molle]|uniref:Uncharacterized protein n=1 Tax=Rhododendron molle TaxID=49168 RepID=A0ACC0NST9_RHOML|nr:hypothetical protein RHMOL_Rhmol05G0180800 [Rhododendron molle]